MTHPRRAAAAAVIAVLGAACVAFAPTADANTTTCHGLPVTVEGAVGTEGDDVMRAPLDAWEGVEGLGGDDTICLVDGRPGSRDPQFFADAGPGDDVVVFEATYSASVILGAGSDRFIGNDVGAYVYTGASAPIPGGVGYFGQTDSEADVVLGGAGRDSVYSGDTGGFAANPDRIATGGSNVDLDRVFYAGRMTPDGELDNGSSRDLLFLVGPWGPGELSIDNVAGRADLAGTEVLRWSSVRQFVVDERPAALRFVGGPAPEHLAVGDYQLGAPGAPMTVDVVTRGGGDYVSLAGALRGRIRLGGGHDHWPSGVRVTARASTSDRTWRAGRERSERAPTCRGSTGSSCSAPTSRRSAPGGPTRSTPSGGVLGCRAGAVPTASPPIDATGWSTARAGGTDAPAPSCAVASCPDERVRTPESIAAAWLKSAGASAEHEHWALSLSETQGPAARGGAGVRRAGRRRCARRRGPRRHRALRPPRPP